MTTAVMARELSMYFPDGAAEAYLGHNRASIRGAARNLNTVNNLLEMEEKVEGSPTNRAKARFLIARGRLEMPPKPLKTKDRAHF